MPFVFVTYDHYKLPGVGSGVGSGVGGPAGVGDLGM